MKKGNIKHLKKLNERLVLDLIRSNELISGAELSRITELQPSTILYILKNLTSKNLIINQGKGESTEKGGKRPNLWQLNKDAAYAIGLDIEIGEIKAVILDLNSNIIAKIIRKTNKIKFLSELIGLIKDIIEDILYSAQIKEEKILGMAIAYAGVVDCEKGLIILGDVIPQINIPLLEELKKLYKFPIKLENNANAAAIGEKWLGNAKNNKNIMTILIEFDYNVSGIGIGLIIDGNLYHGSSFCSGEINVHLPKLQELLENVRHRFKDSEIFRNFISSPEAIDIHVMLDAAKSGDELALSLFSVLGNLIGKNIAKPVALFNPDAILISGPISILNEIITNSIQKAIEIEILSITIDALMISCSKLGEYNVAEGAGSIILKDFFKYSSM
jgi:N-acetylglucosamine repressor